MEINQWWEIRRDIAELEKKIEKYNDDKDFSEDELNQLIDLLERAWGLVDKKC